MPDRSVVVITGASAGVGRATAKAFAENGFNVALLARGQAGLEAASKDVTDAGCRTPKSRS
jgi:short-subunit dehydrogenase